ncbi:hypothetical protein T484DRAFT_1772458, partial [Baffinella frigidus]
MRVFSLMVAAAIFNAAVAFHAPAVSPCSFAAARSAACNVAAKARLPSFGRKSMPLGARRQAAAGPSMKGYTIDLTGKVAFIAGVADASGYGWAIAKQLANAGATIVVGTWPPVLTLFERGLKKGFGEDGMLLDGTQMKIDKIYPLDAMFSNPSEVPEEIKTNKR